MENYGLRIMFGPNTHFSFEGKISFSHRDSDFLELFDSVTELLVEKFSLADFDLLFIPGSATIGAESVIKSSGSKISFPNTEGKFNQRWISISRNYGKLGDNSEGAISMGCTLETSLSRHYSSRFDIVDAISSFPYYNIPEGCKSFITCFNKQIGSFVGLSLVGIRKDSWNLFEASNEFSYLDLLRYKDYSSLSQTPTTTAVHIFSHLRNLLADFDLERLRERIDTNSRILVESLGEGDIIGDPIGPVITVPKKIIPVDLASRWSLYGTTSDSEVIQFFTYSCPDEKYQLFADEFKSYGIALNE